MTSKIEERAILIYEPAEIGTQSMDIASYGSGYYCLELTAVSTACKREVSHGLLRCDSASYAWSMNKEL